MIETSKTTKLYRTFVWRMYKRCQLFNKTMNLKKNVSILFYVLVLLIGCHARRSNLYRIDMDNLGLIATMELPIEFDTMYSWFHLSDNDGNDLYKYRVSKHDFFYMEKGWFWDEPQSKYQVTLSHNRPEIHFEGEFDNEETSALILANMRLEYPKTELRAGGIRN